ncbi:MAG TPA: ATP-dependent DNA ligase, partial [Candidatus Obscuribacter sp.]|nr:ATP-dependent DNA ligase [Candidatus Obscuribacter sp.]
MRRFAALFESLDSSNSQEAKLKSLLEYFREGEAEDLAWAIYFLSGRKIKRVLSTTHLRNFCLCECGLADWLFQECYDNVG